MSDLVARQAISRMNMSVVAMAVAFAGTFTADMAQLARAVPDDEKEKYMVQRRVELCAAYGFTSTEQKKPFAFSNGIAIIPLSGMLINRFGGCYGGYVTGYNFVRQQLALALADDDVIGIIFDCNSYGGEVSGCFETAQLIFEAREKKPSLAVIDSACYSACYALGSAAGRMIATPSGGAGSIGVVAMHVNMEKMLKDWGIDITFIFFGDHKVDGNPYEKLPPDVKKNIQSSINTTGKKFADVVAKHRNMDVQKVIDTQAQCYSADDALALGLIDAIESPEAAARAFLGELTGSTSSTTAMKGDKMSTTTEPGAPQTAGTTTAAAPAAAPAAPAAAAPAAAPAVASTDIATQVAAAVKADRDRMSAIRNCDEAKANPGLANHLAETGMSVDDAKAALKAAGPAATTTAAAPNQFKAAMDGSQHPNVGGEGGGDDSATGGSKADAILALHAKATGQKFDPAKGYH